MSGGACTHETVSLALAEADVGPALLQRRPAGRGGRGPA